jgi:hypothetical protein
MEVLMDMQVVLVALVGVEEVTIMVVRLLQPVLEMKEVVHL